MYTCIMHEVYVMYTPVLSVKDYPVAMGFNHDTASCRNQL